MSDSDPVNPFAAPKQPTIVSEPTINSPIRYEATPTIDDLDSALRPISSFIFPSILMSLLVLVFFGIAHKITWDGLTRGSDIAFLLIFLFFGVLMAVHLRSKINAAKMHLRLNPTATAPLTGELTSEGLRLESENRVSWQPHAGLRFCQVKNNQLSVCHDPLGEAVKILPARGFRNPTQAIQFLESQVNHRSQPVDMLEPLSGPSMIGEPVHDAVAFGGVLKRGDLKRSPLEAIRMQKFNRSAIVLFAVNLVLLPVVFLGNDWGLMIGLGGVIFLYDLFAVTNILRSLFYAGDSELPLIAIQGWLDEQEIALLHNIGQSLTGWQDFKSVGVNDACIWLEPYGGKNRFVLLPRRFFDSETQWEAASRIADTFSTK